MKRHLKTRFRFVVLMAALGVCPAIAETHASLRLFPAILTLDTIQPRGELTMTSFDAHTVIFDLETVVWQQNGDADAFSPTTALVAVPSVYSIEPFRQALVRVGLRDRKEAPMTERAFQVRFREVLPADATQAPRVLEVPVFIEPAERRGEVRYELQRLGPREARLRVHNESNVHAYLGDVRIVSGGGDAYAGSLGTYVLAGNSYEFTLTLARPVRGAQAELILRGPSGESTVNVPIR